MYNIIVYVGLFLIVGIFILFILYEMDKRKKDVELFRQQQLTKSFERAKRND
jgi:capsular polysaccharide biosynthesis protein